MDARKDRDALQAQRLRRRVLAETKSPAVLETRGEWGRMFDRVWFHAGGGLVLDDDDECAAQLARQRPTWAVYQGDATHALAGGLARTRAFDVIDIDTPGRALQLLDAVFRPGRAFPEKFHVVVRDGGRMKSASAAGVQLMKCAHILGRHGGNLRNAYLDAMRECLIAFGDALGFAVTHFEGAYCGNRDALSDYWARFEKTK